MSGPKVFRIVTREEIIAICQAHLNRLNVAVAEWKHVASQTSTDTSAISETLQRREQLRALLQAERFLDLQKRVPEEISFLRADIDKKLQAAAAAKAAQRQAERRTANVARQLLAAFDQQHIRIPADLRHILSGVLPSAALEDAIRKGFDLLASTPDAPITERQRELAGQLGKGLERETLGEWLKKQPTSADDAAAERLDKFIAELAALRVDVSAFEERLQALTNSTQQRRGLLTDSLLADIGNALKAARQRNDVVRKLQERALGLATVESDQAKSHRAKIHDALANDNLTDAPALIDLADHVIAAYTQTLASAARRRAVLKGLAALGYSVNEGMVAAWVQDGGIVVRKPSTADYGVELLGGAGGDRFQVRAVAIGAEGRRRDKSRDRDIETGWCSDFQTLQTLVAREGGSIQIEQSLPIGAVELKLIETVSGEPDAQVDVPGTKERHL